MVQRFEDFVNLVNLAYKGLQKVKSYEVKSLGLKASHVMCVFYLGRSEEGLTAGELCDKCREDKAAISRNLKYLQQKKYVVLRENENQKYNLRYTLTDSGKDAYYMIEARVISCVDKLGKGLTKAERNTFYKAFDVIIGNFDKFCSNLNDCNDFFD